MWLVSASCSGSPVTGLYRVGIHRVITIAGGCRLCRPSDAGCRPRKARNAADVRPDVDRAHFTGLRAGAGMRLVEEREVRHSSIEWTLRCV